MTKTISRRSAYIPHKRVYAPTELMNATTGEWFKPATRVKQSFVAECDINNILKQYSQTGQIKHISAKAQMGAYQDLPDEVDFQTSLNIVKAGETAFMTLPAKTRDRFGNDPQNFLEFMADPKNAEEAIKMGLATKRPDPGPAPSSDGAQKPPKEPPQATTTAPAPKEPSKGS